MEWKRGRGRRKQRMIEDIMENEKYEGMKKEGKINQMEMEKTTTEGR